MKIYVHFKDALLRFESKIYEKYQYLTTPSRESMISFCIVFLGVLATTIIIHDDKAKMAEANVKIVEIQQDMAQFVLLNEVKITKMQIAADIESLKYKLKIAETQAATNPYAFHPTPVNVFIDPNNQKYAIETSDGVTEIEISMIKVNNRTYTPEQRKLMTMAFHIGQDVGFPETIQSLLLQETQAGAYGDRIGDTNLRIGKRSYGVMQMKVATAKKVLKKYPKLIPKYFPTRKTLKRVRDEELIIRLIQDDEFNIRLAALNFNIHRKQSKSWAQAVVAYNTGQGTANKINYPKKHIYYNHILKRMISEVRPFNRETNLTL